MVLSIYNRLVDKPPLPTTTHEEVARRIEALLPIVRIQRGFPHQVLALYENEVITGTSWRQVKLDRADFSNRDPDDVLAKLSPGWRIPLSDLIEINIIGPAERERGDKSWRLELNTPVNTRRFTFPNEDGLNILQYFQIKTPSRLHVTHSAMEHFTWRLRSGCLWLMFVVVATFLVFGFVAMLSGNASILVLAILVGLIGATILGMRIALVPTNQAAMDQKWMGPWGRTMEALYSPVLGWFIKIVGVAWYLFSSLWIEEQTWFHRLERETSGPLLSFLYVLLYAPTLYLVYWGYQLCQRRSTGADYADLSPILWLRAFDDDQRITLQPTNLLARTLGIVVTAPPNFWRVASGMDGSRFKAVGAFMWNMNPIRIIRLFFNKGADTAEEVLTAFFGKLGKVVAFGLPGQRLVTPGAQRLIIDDASWQSAVAERLRHARMVLIQPGASAGVRWEIHKAVELVEPQRLLFSMAVFWRRPNAFEDFLLTLPTPLPDRMPREIPYINRPSFLYFDKEWAPILQPISYRSPLSWAFLGNAVDLKYTLSGFLAGTSSGKSSEPRKPREYGVQTLMAWLLAVILVALGLAGFIERRQGYEFQEHAPARRVKDDFRERMQASHLVTYKNISVPYSLEVDAVWVRDNPSPDVTRFTLGDHRAHMFIFSSKDPGSVSEMTDLHSVLGEWYPGREIRQNRPQANIINGRKWRRTDFELQLDNGIQIYVPSWLYSGKEGTVFIWGELARDDIFILKLIEDTFNSVRIAPPD